MTTVMLAPWTVNSNFEDSDSGWYTDQANKQRICAPNAGGQGDCYLRAHTEGFGPDTYIAQSFYTANFVAEEDAAFRRLNIGDRTNFQYEGLFRCSVTVNTSSSDCVFDIWLQGRDGSGWDPSTDVRTFSVPVDDAWYYVVVDDWPVGGETDIADLFINTRGRHLDIDAQWVSSGI